VSTRLSTPRRTAAVAAVAVLALVLGACGDDDDTTTQTGGAIGLTDAGGPKVTAGDCAGFRNGVGVTDTKITIANASDMSGLVPGLFKDAQQAVEAYVAYFNAGQEICGRKLEYLPLDSRLDVVVNNAGIIRDRMLFGMSDDEWDDVVRVHLRGHFLVTRDAAAHWRQAAKAAGGTTYGRLVNTASEAWLFGSAGQANYAAAKAGIAALTISAARGLGRYGVRANVICPRARTAMTAGVFGDAPQGTAEGGIDPLSVDHVAPFVAYLASPAADRVNGQVFVVHGGMVAHLAPPTVAHRFDTARHTWTTGELAASLGPYFGTRDVDDVFACSELISLT
jgi:NAD(P)-dependent dehydrogenase (short-subunit alcohol dehydrogenase family)